MMMKKKQSHWWRIAWIAVTVPLVGFALTAFSKPKEALKEVVDSSVEIIKQPIVEAFTPEVEEVEVAEVPAPAPVAPVEKVPEADDVKPGDVIKGTVKDAAGPLECANIMEIDEYGRIVATAVTDNNGNYALKVVNPKHKIRISYVGLKSQTLDISSNKMDVMMEQNTMMAQVKVVGRHDSIDNNSPRYKDNTNASESDQVFSVVEQAPTFPGGQGEIMKYLSTHLRYPAVAREMQAEAEITVKFTIDKTGFVRSPKVIEVKATSPIANMTDVSSPSRTANIEFKEEVKDDDEDVAEKAEAFYDTIEALKEEAVYVVRNMPRWEPGRQNGKRIETTYTLPVSFKLAQ